MNTGCCTKIRPEIPGDTMTRGRKPLTALREAERIAQKRGEVRHFAHEREMICTS